MPRTPPGARDKPLRSGRAPLIIDRMRRRTFPFFVSQSLRYRFEKRESAHVEGPDPLSRLWMRGSGHGDSRCEPPSAIRRSSRPLNPLDGNLSPASSLPSQKPIIVRPGGLLAALDLGALLDHSPVLNDEMVLGLFKLFMRVPFGADGVPGSIDA